MKNVGTPISSNTSSNTRVEAQLQALDQGLKINTTARDGQPVNTLREVLCGWRRPGGHPFVVWERVDQSLYKRAATCGRELRPLLPSPSGYIAHGKRASRIRASTPPRTKYVSGLRTA